MPESSPFGALRRLLTLALGTTLAVTLGLAAAVPAQAATASTSIITGVITGRDANGVAVPLANAYVYAEPADWKDSRDIYAHTDASGRFTADVGQPGEYTLYASCDQDTTCDATYAPQYYNGANHRGDATTITVGTSTVTANVRLPRFATVKGKVTTDAGVALAGINVEAYPSESGSVKTDANGAYTLTKVVPGRTLISAREEYGQHNWTAEHWDGATGSTPTYPDLYPVLAEGPTVTTANFSLAPTTGIYGKAVDSAGAPIQGLRWAAYEKTAEGQWQGPQMGPLVTGTNGTFFWATKVGKEYKVCFFDDHYGPEAPERDIRYGARCWDNTTGDVNAATTFTQPASPAQTTLTVTLPVAGKSLTASEVWIDGRPIAGSTLTAHTSGWGPAGVQLAHQWGTYDSNYAFQPIAGATGSTFVPTADLQGKRVVVRVTGTLSGYATATETASTSPVGTGAALTSPLTISGTLAAGQTLTANHGTPVGGAAIDYDGYSWRVDGREVTQNKSVTLTADMVGKSISVRYYVRTTVSNSDTSYVATAGPITAGALTSPVPTISGTAKVGSTLTAASGTWGPAPVTLSYQWKRAGVVITGATASTYALTAADAGQAITVTVTGTKSGYTTVAKTSAATVAVAAGTLTSPVPTISGTAKVGYKLTAAPGTWGPAPVTLSYQWKRAGVAITGATASTYTLTGSDLAKAITVTVTGTKSGYTTVAKTSTATAAVAPGTLTSPVPTISGSKTVGATLTAVSGTWGPAPVTLKYQWYRSGVAISGATLSTYKLTSYDKGKTMTVRITGSKTGYTTVAKTSAATSTVLLALTAPTPTISGTVKVGYTLTAKPGTWGPAPVTLKYQWYRSGVAISGATAATYKLTTTDKGKAMTVRVTGSKSGYTTVTKASAATAAVL